MYLLMSCAATYMCSLVPRLYHALVPRFRCISDWSEYERAVKPGNEASTCVCKGYPLAHMATIRVVVKTA